MSPGESPERQNLVKVLDLLKTTDSTKPSRYLEEKPGWSPVLSSDVQGQKWCCNKIVKGKEKCYLRILYPAKLPFNYKDYR